MLILMRHVEEDIVIKTPKGMVIIRVTRIRGEQVQLAIEAPKEINIRRSEVKDDGRSRNA